MANKQASVAAEPAKAIVFKCNFCHETKPFSELVVLRHYFPQISVCQDCSRGCSKDSQ